VSTATAPPGQSTVRATTTSQRSPTGGATNVRLPATFVLHPGGILTPASISSPAFLALDVTVISADSRSHLVTLRTPVAHALKVAPRVRVSLLIPGLKAGRYPIYVDGVQRGALVLGGEPGP
jgi:hypothetical protein